MTARFGRNKRRAAREALAAAQRHNDILTYERDVAVGLAAVHKAARYDAERLLGEISERLTRAVGAKTGLLPIEQQPKQGSRREPWARKEPILQDLDGYIAMTAMPAPLSIDVENDVETLLRLVTFVERHPDKYRRIIRFVDPDDVPHPKFSGRAMWVSEDMLRSVGLMGGDVLHLSYDIARQLVERPARAA